jgi:hypothetical protein
MEEWKIMNGLDELWSNQGTKKYPSSTEIQKIMDKYIDSEESDIILSSIVIQCILKCPPKGLASTLSGLMCSYWRNDKGDIDVNMLYQFQKTVKKPMCGKPIKKGDILWSCRQCGSDSTCVQCDACFKLSDHTNHDVYFHRSNDGGGCCDCGDTEGNSH